MVFEFHSYTECDAKQEFESTKNLQFREIFNSFYLAIMVFNTEKTLFLLSDTVLDIDFD